MPIRVVALAIMGVCCYKLGGVYALVLFLMWCIKEATD